MKKIITIFSALLMGITLQAQEYDTKKMRYIEQYKYWAMDEQIRIGVPAAISLAQGILETGSGTSELCTQANNHFGIKCKKEWTGETYLHDDDRRRECFRKYKSAKDSYIDHSNFLSDREHYRFLFDLETTDYQGWCTGLRKAGYATNPKYATRLIQLIEKYNLQEYTYEAIELTKARNEAAVANEVVPATDKPIENIRATEVVEVVNVAPNSTNSKANRVYDKRIEKNGRPGFWAHKGDYLLPDAVHYNIRYAKLLSLNDLDDSPLYDDMFVYLKKKAKKGNKFSYVVKEGESLHSISQQVGVQLKYLYIYNNLYDNEEPAVGEKIYLQGRSGRTPKLRGATAVATSSTKVPTTIVEKPRTISTIKKEVVSSKVPQEKTIKKEKVVTKKITTAKKKDAYIGVTNNLETETKMRTIPKKVIAPTKVIEEPKKKVVAINKIKVIEQKPSEKAKTVYLIEKQQSSTSPILNLEKAKKVESLMGNGNREVEKIYIKNQEIIKKKKVAAATLSNTQSKEVKEIKTQQMVIEKKNQKPNNDDKNVSDDVKNLKKKFDRLIYEE